MIILGLATQTAHARVSQLLSRLVTRHWKHRLNYVLQVLLYFFRLHADLI